MAGVPYAAFFTQPDADETKPHIFAFSTARATPGSLLFDIWNGATSAGRKFSIDLDGTVTATTFVGALTGAVAGNVVGNVTGNASGSSGSCTGNAATATLATNATTAATATAVAASNGAVGTPSIAFSNSSTTGFYRAAGDIIGVAIAGVQLALFSAATATYFAKVGTTEYYMVLGTQVVGSQGAAVADATDAASVILRFNELAARCRAHGLIAS